jgi:hypothetical protein
MSTQGKRISKEEKRIADRHIFADQQGGWHKMVDIFKTEDLISELEAGKAFKEVLLQIERDHCSEYSIRVSKDRDYMSDDYLRGVYKGFKKLLRRE